MGTSPEDGGSIFLRNTGTHLHSVTTQTTTKVIFTTIRTTDLIKYRNFISEKVREVQASFMILSVHTKIIRTESHGYNYSVQHRKTVYLTREQICRAFSWRLMGHESGLHFASRKELTQLSANSAVVLPSFPSGFLLSSFIF
jgi:hypothetical protein